MNKNTKLIKINEYLTKSKEHTYDYEEQIDEIYDLFINKVIDKTNENSSYLEALGDLL